MGHTSSRNKEVHRRDGTARLRRSQPMSRKARRKRDRLMTKPHAEAARSKGFRLVVCCLCLDLTRLDARTLGVRYSWDRPQSIEASSSCSEGSSALRLCATACRDPSRSSCLNQMSAPHMYIWLCYRTSAFSLQTLSPWLPCDCRFACAIFCQWARLAPRTIGLA